MSSDRIGTYNEEQEMVDLYIPRKCNASNQLIQTNDYASIQIAVAQIEADGTYNGTTQTFCIKGVLRTQAASDHAINRLCISNGIIRPKTGNKTQKIKKANEEAAKANRNLSAKHAAEKKKASGRGVARGQSAGGRGRGASRGDRPPRREGDRKEGDDRKPRGPRPDGDRPPRKDGDRPPRREGDRPPRREGDDRKPRGPRPEGDRPERKDGDRKPRVPKSE